jgi:hypothetical protein
MPQETVFVFEPYPFIGGEKIHIESGPRRGDWEVIGVSERKIKLRCPISMREVEWDRFCYFMKKKQTEAWPRVIS